MNTDTILLIITMIISACALAVGAVALLRRRGDKPGGGHEGGEITDIVDDAVDEVKDGMIATVKGSEEIIKTAITSASGTQASVIGQYMGQITQIAKDTEKNITIGFANIERQLGEAIDKMNASVEKQLDKVRKDTCEKLDKMSYKIEVELDKVRKETGQQLEKVREDNEKQLEKVRSDNEVQLSKMRDTVDEKLSKTLNDRLTQSFQSVQTSLDNVNKGLGEMRELSVNVRDINKLMSGVKTRGIWGEQALGALLQELLVPEQYYEQKSIKRGSSEKVDFAVRMPGSGGDEVLLPIDCKFPAENYIRLTDALDAGNIAEAEAARKALNADVLAQGRSIRDKYINVPLTTDFAIMYLPSEGLYAEVIRSSATVDKLRQDCKVTVSGPSTMTALLNSLQMGFRTLKIQKNSKEVQDAFARFGRDFSKFTQLIDKAQEQNKKVYDTLDDARDRNKKIQEKLDKINRNNPSADMIEQDAAADLIGDNYES